MITIAICDDNPIHLKRTEELVQHELEVSHVQHVELDCFPGYESMRKVLKSGDYQPDVVILDVVLEEDGTFPGNFAPAGIDLAQELNRILPSCRIIFLSGYPEHISASYEAEHVWYVLKSQATTYLGPALRKALSAPGMSPVIPGINVRNNRHVFFLPLDEILYIDRDGRRTRVVCEAEQYLVSGTPAGILGSYADNAFVRCHQSYWVNLSAVKELDREELVLRDGSRIPIGRTYRAETRERFFARFRA